MTTKITVEKCEALREALEPELKRIGKETGLDLSIGAMTYGDKITCRLTALPAGVDPEAVEWKRCCVRYGLKPEHLNEVISFRGSKFKLIGLNTRRRKYPLTGLDVDNGKRYKLPVEAAAELKR